LHRRVSHHNVLPIVPLPVVPPPTAHRPSRHRHTAAHCVVIAAACGVAVVLPCVGVAADTLAGVVLR